MKPTGIVRRIDDLGRIVIPKEIRRAMKIKEGDALEIYTERNGSIVLCPYFKSWEVCVLDWYNAHGNVMNAHYIHFTESGDYTICTINSSTIGIAKHNPKDIRDCRIGKTIAYFHALGYDSARINKEIGYRR